MNGPNGMFDWMYQEYFNDRCAWNEAINDA